MARLKNKAPNFLSSDEIRQLATPSDVQGVRAVAITWLLIGAAFALVAWLPNPLTVLMAIVVIGTRQLSLAIIMHEGAHKTLTKNPRLNDFFGHWLGAAPLFQDMFRYRIHHMKHHSNTGTEADPDLRLQSGFPVTKASLRRKFIRDFSGITGYKGLLGSLLMLTGFIKYDVSGNVEKAERPSGLVQAVAGIAPVVVSNLVLFAVLSVTASGWLYLLWIVSYMTVYQFVLRMRSIAEHAMTTDASDALNNSRTTYARGWQRFFFAPLRVNYHLEHHMLPTVPFYNLPRMHELLKERGAFENGAAICRNYGEVLKLASSAG